MKNRYRLLTTIFAFLCLSGYGAGDEPVALHGTSVTVWPIQIEIQARPASSEMAIRITEVLGLMLENAGMSDVRIAETAWTTEEADFASAFSSLVRAAPPESDTAIWVRFAGTNGLERIDWVVCDRDGGVRTQDASQFQDSPPNDPMEACLHVARTLQEVSDLDDPTRPSATEGRMARILRERSGLPSQAEIEAAKTRLLALNQNLDAECQVYPVRVAGAKTTDTALAGVLATRLNAAGLGGATGIATELHLDVPGDPNEMKVLWDTARAFRDHLRNTPAEKPYALLVDCGPIPGVQFVHVFLCEGNGDWVVVDMQNNHHADFQQIAPATVEDCIDLAVRRLQTRIGDSAGAP